MAMTKEQTDTVSELRELARAIRIYIIQDSRSERRRKAMMDGADDALFHVQEAFGDET